MYESPSELLFMPCNEEKQGKSHCFETAEIRKTVISGYVKVLWWVTSIYCYMYCSCLCAQPLSNIQMLRKEDSTSSFHCRVFITQPKQNQNKTKPNIKKTKPKQTEKSKLRSTGQVRLNQNNPPEVCRKEFTIPHQLLFQNIIFGIKQPFWAIILYIPIPPDKKGQSDYRSNHLFNLNMFFWWI